MIQITIAYKKRPARSNDPTSTYATLKNVEEEEPKPSTDTDKDSKEEPDDDYEGYV